MNEHHFETFKKNGLKPGILEEYPGVMTVDGAQDTYAVLFTAGSCEKPFNFDNDTHLVILIEKGINFTEADWVKYHKITYRHFNDLLRFLNQYAEGTLMEDDFL